MSLSAGYQLGPRLDDLAVVARWSLRYVSRETAPDHTTRPSSMQAHLVCAECDQSVCCMTPDVDAGSYALCSQVIVSGVLAHLKQCHEDALPRT